MLPEDPDKQAEAPVNPKELTADDPGMEAAIQELKGEPLVLQQDAAITKPRIATHDRVLYAISRLFRGYPNKRETRFRQNLAETGQYVQEHAEELTEKAYLHVVAGDERTPYSHVALEVGGVVYNFGRYLSTYSALFGDGSILIYPDRQSFAQGFLVKKDGRRKVVSHSFSIPISPEGVERIQKDIEENTAPYRQELIMKRRGIENPQDLPPAFKEGEVWVRATVRADYNIPDVPNTGVLGMLIDERTFNLFLTNCTSFALRSLSQANPQYRKLFGEVLMEEDHPVFRAIVMFKCFCLSVLAGIVRHVKDGENRDKRHIDGILHNALRHSEEARLFDEMIAIVPPDGLVDILARDEDNAVFSAEAEVVAELNRMALATRVD